VSCWVVPTYVLEPLEPLPGPPTGKRWFVRLTTVQTYVRLCILALWLHTVIVHDSMDSKTLKLRISRHPRDCSSSPSPPCEVIHQNHHKRRRRRRCTSCLLVIYVLSISSQNSSFWTTHLSFLSLKQCNDWWNYKWRRTYFVVPLQQHKCNPKP